MPTTSKSPVRQVVLYGFAMECFLAGMLIPRNPGDDIPLFLLLYFCAFLMFLGAVRNGCGLPGGNLDARKLFGLIILFALLFRATLFFSEPGLSEDIYRYVWDGKVLNAGINPYRYAPGANELAGLRDDQYAMINHKEIGTPYGPLAMAVFAAAQGIADSVYFMKLPFILFDCLSILLVARLLALTGGPVNNVMIYAWNPLVLVEVAGSGHNDSLGVFMLLAACYAIYRGRHWAASAGFALAFLAKYFSLLFLPVFLKYFRRNEWVLVPLLLAAGFLPFNGYLETHFLNLMEVGSSWRFNDSLFSVLWYVTGSLLAAKMMVVGLMLALSVLVLYSRRPLHENAMIMIGGALMLTTTVQPWYLLWMIPFLCLSPNRAWLLLSALTMLSYHVLIRYREEGVWVENGWIRLAVYLPFYLILINDLIRKNRYIGT